MPVIKYEQINPESSWAVWKIDESIHDFMNQVTLDKYDRQDLSVISNMNKKLEWFSSRLAIKYLLQRQQVKFNGITKDQYNKPFLKNHSSHISISHSFPYASAIVHAEKPVGIDIEQPRSKILRVAKKFLNEKERDFAGDDLELLSILWSAKEVLYKIHGRKKLTFRQHLFIQPFEKKNDGIIDCSIVFDKGRFQNYKLKFYKINNHFVVFNH